MLWLYCSPWVGLSFTGQLRVNRWACAHWERLLTLWLLLPGACVLAGPPPHSQRLWETPLPLAFHSLLPSTWFPSNCCPISSKLLIWKTLPFPKATVNITDSQKSNPFQFSFQRKQVKFFQQLNLLCFLLQVGRQDSEGDGRRAVKIWNWNIWIKAYIKNTYYFQLRKWIDNFMKQPKTTVSHACFISVSFYMLVPLL